MKRPVVTIPRGLRAECQHAIGRNLDEDVKHILKEAVGGIEVDALSLNRALMAAMATSATRGATSPSRRALAADIGRVAAYVQNALEGRAQPATTRKPYQFDPDEIEEWISA